MESYLVSIIMPTFNSEKTVLLSVDSVINQSYSNWELLITDDSSSDNTWDLLVGLSKLDARIKIYKNSKNMGAGYTRNNSISISKGRFIAFLDSDDLWHEDKLKNQIKFMLDNDYALTYTQYQKFSKDGCLGVVRPPKTTTYNQLLFSNVIGCLTAIYDAEKLGKRYMPLIRKRQDMGLWLDILEIIPKAYCLESNLAKYRVDMGMTSNKLKVLNYQWSFYRDVVGLNIFRSLFTFFVYAWRGFIKSLI